ncbi:MAG: hypothetical protein GY953_19900, partial [bacterium]|nr:hypothetical protein [bacterium]
MEFSLEDVYPYLTIAGRIVLLFAAAWVGGKVLDLLIRRLRSRIVDVM